jgi:maltooligosyltrehalose trehalohydrolase
MSHVSNPRIRRLPIGAEPHDGGVHFRVWAPEVREVEVVFESSPEARLAPDDGGYHSGFVPGLSPGAAYRFRLDGRGPFPDPASRFQPDGPHGPSQVVDPSLFPWSDRDWPGLGANGQVLYELHLGTFTPEGSWEGAARELLRLRRLGVTAVELMPVADFPGRFGWGYDGVNLFAPCRLYGSPDDFRRFVDRAHEIGLGVILDVVYNHFGPDGNYLAQFSPRYFNERHACDWGAAINVDGTDAAPVREFFISNAEYWIREFHLDGLRFDAVHAIVDRSPEHVLAAIQRRIRNAAAPRLLFLVAEDDQQRADLARPVAAGGIGLDGIWNDDFHHAARVALTGKREGYYADFRGTPQELMSALKWGYLFQGQLHSGTKKPRGTPAFDLPGSAFVTYLENHDQVAHSGSGLRLPSLAPPVLHRALTALLLLSPGTPLLFQGQEYGSTKPFLYFAEHEPELAAKIFQGRKKFHAQFASLAGPEAQAALTDPSDPETFRRCVLDPSERERHPETLRLHHDLLELRRTDPVFRAQRSDRLFGAALSPDAFVLRFFDPDAGDRLLLFNLGADLELRGSAEPLLAPPREGAWTLRWSSEQPDYGGSGVVPPFREDGVFLASRSAAVLTAIAS